MSLIEIILLLSPIITLIGWFCYHLGMRKATRQAYMKGYFDGSKKREPEQHEWEFEKNRTNGHQ